MVRYRIRYQKVGALRFVSHRDLLRIFRRSLASSGVPVCFSRGFNPHPRVSFGPSLRTGWEGLDEYLDVQLERAVDDLGARCNSKLPDGLRIIDCAGVGGSVPKLSADIKAARYEITVDKGDLQEGRNAAWDRFTRAPEATARDVGWQRLCRALEDELTRRFGSGSTDDSDGARDPSLLDIKITETDGELRVDYLSTMEQGRSLFPEMLQRYIGDSLGLGVPPKVVRTALLVERDGAYHSPISKGVVQNLL